MPDGVPFATHRACAYSMRMRGKPVGSQKVPTNLSLRADLVRRAKELGINLSEVVDVALEQVISAAEREAWLASNQDAIAEYNALAEQRGVFSDAWRKF